MRAAVAKLAVAEQFEWPSNDFADFTATLPVAEFVAWLWQIGERDFPIEQLMPLYHEWCCHVESRPLTQLKLQRQLTALGVERYRPAPRMINGEVYRPTRYRVPNSLK